MVVAGNTDSKTINVPTVVIQQRNECVRITRLGRKQGLLKRLQSCARKSA
jgi:hypothetical protein